MNALTRRAALCVAVVGLLTASLPVTAGAPAPLADGKADGTLTVNGKTTKVAFAYAKSVPDFFDNKKKAIEVILSDVPLDAKALADSFARSDLADKGKIHTFEITIGAAGVPISTNWHHNGFKGPTPSGLSTADVFTKKVLDGKIIEASYKSAGQSEFFGNTSGFDVRFRAKITH